MKVREPLLLFDTDVIIEEIRQFIYWLDDHTLSVKQRLETYREQRRTVCGDKPD